MTFDQVKTKAVKQWDGYLVITPAVARRISTTGKLVEVAVIHARTPRPKEAQP